MRLRITFAKTEAMRFTSHLDLHRTWERTFRRAELPLAYSQGYTPHPRLNLACALPLGFTSEGEVIDAWLEEQAPIPEIRAALERASPPGMRVLAIEEADEREAALQTELEAAEFVITLAEPLPDLERGCQALLQAQSLPRQRRGKAYDLRPLIHDLQPAPDDDQGRQRLTIRLSAREGATGRPEEVIAALGAAAEGARVHRTRLIFRAERPASREA
jgi:radical SAM-linked protein